MLPSASEEVELAGTSTPTAPLAILSEPAVTSFVSAAVLAVFLAMAEPTLASVSSMDALTSITTVDAASDWQVLESARPDLTAIAQLRSYRGLEEGWKGPNSSAPAHEALEDAETFVRKYLSLSNREAPIIGVASDGEVVFFWKTSRIVLDLSIAGDGTYAYFAKSAGGQPYFADDAPIGQPLPDEVLALLQMAPNTHS